VLVVNGQDVPCEVDVFEWWNHGMRFGRLPTRTKTTKVVLHWTGGTGDSRRVYDTLLEKQLSVHFCVDAAGKVWQYCDANSLCAHAGRLDDGVTSANADTIAIEIINHARHEQRGLERPMTAETINGRRMLHADFLPAQVESAVALCKALCTAYKLPLRVPVVADAIVARAMGRDAWERFRGVVGHFHARSTKSDPGLAILAAVRAAGF
jgi:N-acetyl-anhydromuramyl-L-alanine amidase AmpD